MVDILIVEFVTSLKALELLVLLKENHHYNVTDLSKYKKQDKFSFLSRFLEKERESTSLDGKRPLSALADH